MIRWMNRREALGLASALAVTASVRARAQPSATAGGLPFETDAIAWLRRNARPIDSHDPAPAALAAAADALADAQVIGVGEATLGGHEEQSLKAALVKALIARGDIRLLALEGNSRAASQLDRYVRGGDGDPLETIRTTAFPQAWLTEPFVALINWIRGWNVAAPSPVGIVGTESQSLGADAFDAYRWLDNNAQRLAQPLDRALQPLFANPRLRDAPTHELVTALSSGMLTAARNALVQLHAAILAVNREGQEEAAARALSARQSLDAALRGGTGGAGGAAARGQQLAENLLSASANGRAILWSDNDGVTTRIGATLRARLARRYRAVTFAFDSGSVHTREGNPADSLRGTSPWQVVERASVPGSLGALLGAAGPDRFWVNLTPPSDPPPSAWTAHAYQPLPLAPHSDLLLFVRRLTPSRLYPFVPRR